MNAIEVEDLRKTYRNGVEALRGISFHVEEGEIFGLLGPNGAGKSTAVRILCTLSLPTSGSARVVGVDVLADPDEVRRRIGYVPQDSSVDIQATGRENLELQGHLQDLSGPQLRDRVGQLLERFDLVDAADRMVETWSGGMKRRLDVAMGLIHRPRLLFLDEPTTGLDPESRTVMWREVRELAGDEGVSVLLTTHYLEEADRLSRRLAIVDHGEIVARGTPDELKSELRGDRVTVELSDGADAARGAERLASLGTGGEVVREDRVLHVQVTNGARAVPGIVAALEDAGIEIAQVALARPSLDDVYLRATGHTFESADAAGAAAAGGGGGERIGGGEAGR
ncbi:MAG TPA: ATP-binding cassette domain-containing protein [Gemmatimonadota bacterium]|nr:ATP-binding cassette domain-containing protein [Gemmatimonadota bacterium]